MPRPETGTIADMEGDINTKDCLGSCGKESWWISPGWFPHQWSNSLLWHQLPSRCSIFYVFMYYNNVTRGKITAVQGSHLSSSSFHLAILNKCQTLVNLTPVSTSTFKHELLVPFGTSAEKYKKCKINRKRKGRPTNLSCVPLSLPLSMQCQSGGERFCVLCQGACWLLPGSTASIIMGWWTPA